MKNQTTETIDIKKLTIKEIEALYHNGWCQMIDNLTLKQIKSDKEFMEGYMFRKQMYGVGTYKQEYEVFLHNRAIQAELLKLPDLK
jgi:hypothetical protein